jgi:hypothetical protein
VEARLSDNQGYQKEMCEAEKNFGRFENQIKKEKKLNVELIILA